MELSWRGACCNCSCGPSSGTNAVSRITINSSRTRFADRLNSGGRRQGECMATGGETRAAIDTEAARGLLLVNGGGAVALLAFLSSIIDKPHLHTLVSAVMVAVFFLQVGLVAVVIHNRLRRLCSAQYALQKTRRGKCKLFGRELERPCLCHWSAWMFALSVFAFVSGGLIVLVVGLQTVTEGSLRNQQPMKIEITVPPMQQLPPDNSSKPTPLRGAS